MNERQQIKLLTRKEELFILLKVTSINFVSLPRFPGEGAQVVTFSNNIRPASAVDKCEVPNEVPRIREGLNPL